MDFVEPWAEVVNCYIILTDTECKKKLLWYIKRKTVNKEKVIFVKFTA